MATQPKETPKENPEENPEEKIARETYIQTRNSMGFTKPPWEDIQEETRNFYRKWVSDNKYYQGAKHK